MRCARISTSGAQPSAWIAVLALLCASAAPVHVRAQDEEPSEYREFVRQGVEAYDRADWAAAYAAFERAHALYPNARTLRSLGAAAFEAQHYVKALQHSEAALLEQRRALTDDQRKEAQALIARAQTLVAHCALVVSPAGAQVAIDGERSVTAGAATDVLLDPGAHELVIAATGYATQTQRLSVQPGEHARLEVALAPAASPAAPVAGAPPPQTGARAGHRSLLGPYIVLGAAGVLLASSAVTGVLTAGAASKLEDECSKDGRCDPDLESTRNRGQTLQVATNVLLVTGAAAAIAGGVYLWLQLRAPEAPAAPRAALVCAAGGCVASYSGRF